MAKTKKTNKAPQRGNRPTFTGNGSNNVENSVPYDNIAIMTPTMAECMKAVPGALKGMKNG